MINWGRFTARGEAEVEEAIRAIVEDLTHALDTVLTATDYRSVILIGGYGRGEGGVWVDATGRERPHNNLDVLVITRRRTQDQNLEQAKRTIATLSNKHDIGIDLGWVREDSLKRSPCLVMWYDMRFGHKLLLGDPAFVPRLKRFTAERIVPADVRNLLVNRGTLLVINELLLAAGQSPAPEVQRAVVRHATKAIIGYGDALLYFLGDYHFSYQEKQRRMARRRDVPTGFRRLYDEAMEFRFRPRYGDFKPMDLARRNETLLEELAPIHLDCERRRLNHRSLSWADYPSLAFRRAATDGNLRARTLARKTLTVARRPPLLRELGPLSRIAAQAAPAAERLPTVFPIVAYDLGDPRLVELARQTVGAVASDRASLQRAYLQSWGDHVDGNFATSLSRLGVSLEGGGR